MKKITSFFLIGLLAVGVMLTGCKLVIENPVVGTTFTAYLGGETGANLTVNSATLNGEALSGTPHSVTGAGWNDYTGWFEVPEIDTMFDFTLVMDVTLDAVGANNWQKWAFALYDDATEAQWYLRADAWSNDAGGYNIAYTKSWENDAGLHEVYAAGSNLIFTVTYTASNGTVVVSVSKGGDVVYTATATK